MKKSIHTTLAYLAACLLCSTANADTFLNITQAPNHNIFATADNLLSNNTPISTGGAVWAATDAYFAENGTWYTIDGTNTWRTYASALDVALNNSTGTGTAAVASNAGYFAADDSYYVIDSNDVWHQFGSAADMLGFTNEVASGASFWGSDDGFFAVDGAYYNINGGNQWTQYATASDLFSNTNVVASGVSFFDHQDGFAADSAAVPEPSSATALAAMLGGAIGIGRRRRRS